MVETYLRLCAEPGCPALVRHGRCQKHTPPRNETARSLRRGATGWDRQRRNREMLSREPWCGLCGRMATEIDHVIPLAKGGTDATANLQPLCASCHKAKTGRE